MTILITGANGFVGGNVSRYLSARGMSCVALDVKGIPGQGAYDKRYTWDELDRLEPNAFDAVIHLAGKAHDTKNTTEAKRYFDINVGLTQRVINWYQRAPSTGKRTFIFFSSVKACADTVEGVLTEECIPKPGTPYGQSKLEAEGEVLTFNSSNVLNVRTIILRPAMIHGPGNKGNLNLLIQIVRKRIPWPLAAFENQRSFVSVKNVGCVLEALIKDDVKSGVYQVADDAPLSTNRLIVLIAEALGRRASLWRIPCGLMRNIARLGDQMHLPLNSERLKKLTESYVVSNKKLLKALGWEQMPVSAEAGMRETLIETTQWSQSRD